MIYGTDHSIHTLSPHKTPYTTATSPPTQGPNSIVTTAPAAAAEDVKATVPVVVPAATLDPVLDVAVAPDTVVLSPDPAVSVLLPMPELILPNVNGTAFPIHVTPLANTVDTTSTVPILLPSPSSLTPKGVDLLCNPCVCTVNDSVSLATSDASEA